MSHADLIQTLIKCQNTTSSHGRTLLFPTPLFTSCHSRSFLDIFSSICQCFFFKYGAYLPFYTPAYLLFILSFIFNHFFKKCKYKKREKNSYGLELHIVSILPSLNDLNKEFNTMRSEKESLVHIFIESSLFVQCQRTLWF